MEAIAPIQAGFPPVKNLHSSVPLAPVGCDMAGEMINCTLENNATVISATAKFIRR